MKTILIAILFSSLLMGCATQKPAPIEVTKYVFVKVPGELTAKTPLATPPDPNAYVLMSWDQKEDTLMKFIQTRTSEVISCDAHLDGIDAWSVKQSAIYAAPDGAK